VNFKVLNKGHLLSGSTDLQLTGFELELAILRRTLFNGDCVEQLTSGAQKV
jgi:hypothetical protein